MPKFTQGPWEVTKKESKGHVDRFVVTGGNRFVANASRSNSDLIAAAPDMLEAMKDAVLFWEDHNFDKQTIYEPWYWKAKDAIAKAEGKENGG
ncbi:MAG: hypothetical protein JEY79_10990 [Pseudodesulfovibrio sp.]|nr:hypothetical protein [Pseudodesulfovibrio sp.]